MWGNEVEKTSGRVPSGGPHWNEAHSAYRDVFRREGYPGEAGRQWRPVLKLNISPVTPATWIWWLLGRGVTLPGCTQRLLKPHRPLVDEVFGSVWVHSVWKNYRCSTRSSRENLTDPSRGAIWTTFLAPSSEGVSSCY